MVKEDVEQKSLTMLNLVSQAQCDHHWSAFCFFVQLQSL